jgi:hypothetical protein
MLADMQVLAAERDAQLRQCQSQNDLLHDKVRVLTDSYYALESERTRAVADLQGALNSTREQLSHYLDIETQLDSRIEAAAQVGPAPGSDGGGGSGTAQLAEALGEGGGAGALPTSARRRVQHGLALSQRCAQLERERAGLTRQRDALERERDSLKRGAQLACPKSVTSARQNVQLEHRRCNACASCILIHVLASLLCQSKQHVDLSPPSAAFTGVSVQSCANI